MKSTVVSVVIIAFTVSGCTAMVPRSGRQWQSCAVGAVGGAAVGAATGAAIGAIVGGKKGAGTGAAIGAIAGLLPGCAVASAITAEDEAKIADAERRALRSGNTESSNWKNEEGAQRQFNVAVEPIADQGGQTCRRTRGKLVDAASGDSGETTRVYCRTGEGDWIAA